MYSPQEFLHLDTQQNVFHRFSRRIRCLVNCETIVFPEPVFLCSAAQCQNLCHLIRHEREDGRAARTLVEHGDGEAAGGAGARAVRRRVRDARRVEFEARARQVRRVEAGLLRGVVRPRLRIAPPYLRTSRNTRLKH